MHFVSEAITQILANILFTSLPYKHLHIVFFLRMRGNIIKTYFLRPTDIF